MGRALSGIPRVEEAPDGAWSVRPVAGAAAGKTYRCPGCDQEIAAGVAHLVVWSAEPLGVFGSVADRRHWHTPCWRSRGTRRRR